jgi:hypothetical protein
MDRTLVSITAMCCLTVMTLIVGVSYVNVTDTKAISDMVAKGADPQAAACSVNKNATSSNVCLTLASKNKQ